MIKLLLVIFWMGLIFSFSSDPADVSTKKSDGVIIRTVELFLDKDLSDEIARAQAAEKAAEKYHVPFLYRDFRPGFQDGQSKARELELYLQKYCGCIFSEEERYRRKQLEKERLQKELT